MLRTPCDEGLPAAADLLAPGGGVGHVRQPHPPPPHAQVVAQRLQRDVARPLKVPRNIYP
jgi:hypothetical protein